MTRLTVKGVADALIEQIRLRNPDGDIRKALEDLRNDPSGGRVLVSTGDGKLQLLEPLRDGYEPSNQVEVAAGAQKTNVIDAVPYGGTVEIEGVTFRYFELDPLEYQSQLGKNAEIAIRGDGETNSIFGVGGWQQQSLLQAVDLVFRAQQSQEPVAEIAAPVELDAKTQDAGWVQLDDSQREFVRSALNRLFVPGVVPKSEVEAAIAAARSSQGGLEAQVAGLQLALKPGGNTDAIISQLEAKVRQLTSLVDQYQLGADKDRVTIDRLKMENTDLARQASIGEDRTTRLAFLLERGVWELEQAKRLGTFGESATNALLSSFAEGNPSSRLTGEDRRLTELFSALKDLSAKPSFGFGRNPNIRSSDRLLRAVSEGKLRPADGLNPSTAAFDAKWKSVQDGAAFGELPGAPVGFNAVFTAPPAEVQSKSTAQGVRSTGFYALETGALASFQAVATSDGPVRSLMEDVLKYEDSLINNTGDSPEILEARARRPWLQLASYNPLRSQLIDNIHLQINRQSTAIKKAMDANPEVKPYWRTLILGAGVHAAEVANEMSLRNPNQSILTVDAGKLVSANFANSGDVFRINSTNRAEDGRLAVPGQGNINPIKSPVGVPDISGHRWTQGQAIAQASAIGLYASGSDFLMEEQVVSVSKRGPKDDWPGKYEVEFSTGRKVYCDQVFTASGVGEPTLPFKDRSTRNLVKGYMDQVDFARPDYVPPFVSFENATRLLELSDVPLDPYRAVTARGEKPTTAVIGFGDSGRVFLEYLNRLGPDSGYDGKPGKSEKAQRGEVGPLIWFTGKGGPSDCDEYLKGFGDQKGARTRYQQISGAIKSGKIKLIPGRVVAAEPAENDQFKLIYETATGRGSVLVDRSVLCTGYESKVGDVYRNVLPDAACNERFDNRNKFEQSKYVEFVTGQIRPDIQGEKPLGKRIKGEDIYLVGPAAGTDVVSPAETAGIIENTASIFALGPRSAALGRLTAQGVGEPVKKFAWTEPPKPLLEQKPGSGSTSFELDISDVPPRPVDAWATFSNKLLWSNVLGDYEFKGLDEVSITINPKQTAKGRSLELSSEQLGATQLAALSDTIREIYGADGLNLLHTVAGAKPLTLTASVTDPEGSGRGRADPATLRVLS